jgi:hypothetical protein
MMNQRKNLDRDSIGYKIIEKILSLIYKILNKQVPIKKGKKEPKLTKIHLDLIIR